MFDCVFLSFRWCARARCREAEKKPPREKTSRDHHQVSRVFSRFYLCRRAFSFNPLLRFFLFKLTVSLSLSLFIPKNIQRDTQSGGLLYTCGCVAFVPETMEIVEGGIEAETRQALTNMGEILKAGGSDFSKVVKTTIFITNMADFPKVNAIYSEFFDTPGPARSTVGVASLPKGGLIEIDAIAEC